MKSISHAVRLASESCGQSTIGQSIILTQFRPTQACGVSWSEASYLLGSAGTFINILPIDIIDINFNSFVHMFFVLVHQRVICAGAPEDAISNVFTEVLSPEAHGSSSSQQLEISYVMTDKRNRLSVVLHRARLVVLLDWLLQGKEFLLTKAEDLKQEDSEDEDTDEVDFHHPTPSPVGKSDIPKKESKPLDINLSVTQTDFVVVEDITDVHSNAVILKWTLVLTSHESDRGERSLGMSLSEMELFSCWLGSEEDTALSIIDPASVSVSLEPQSLCSKSQIDRSSFGRTDASELPTLEIIFQTGANIRVSYRDLELFLAILSTLKRQVQGQSLLSTPSPEPEFESGSDTEGSDTEATPVNSVLLSRLNALGYPEPLCHRALRETGGDLNRAADWLVDNAPEMKEEVSKPAGKKLPVGFVDVSTNSVLGHPLYLCF